MEWSCIDLWERAVAMYRSVGERSGVAMYRSVGESSGHV